MTGAAAEWFDQLLLKRPDTVASWSSFIIEFKQVFIVAISDRSFTRPYDRLRSIRMTGSFQQFVVEFNLALARIGKRQPDMSAECFEEALPSGLYDELEMRQITDYSKDPSRNWPSLAEMQSTAASILEGKR